MKVLEPQAKLLRREERGKETNDIPRGGERRDPRGRGRGGDYSGLVVWPKGDPFFRLPLV